MYDELLRLSQTLTVITHLNKARRCMKTKDQLEFANSTLMARLHVDVSVPCTSFQPSQMSHMMLLCTALFSIVSVLSPAGKRITLGPTSRFLHATAMPVSVKYTSSHHVLYTTVVPSPPATLLLDAQAPRPKPLSGATSTSDVCTGAIPP